MAKQSAELEMLASYPAQEQGNHMRWAINHAFKRVGVWKIPQQDRDAILGHLNAALEIASKYVESGSACPRCQRAVRKGITVKSGDETLFIHLTCAVPGDAFLKK